MALHFSPGSSDLRKDQRPCPGLACANSYLGLPFVRDAWGTSCCLVLKRRQKRMLSIFQDNVCRVRSPPRLVQRGCARRMVYCAVLGSSDCLVAVVLDTPSRGSSAHGSVLYLGLEVGSLWNRWWGGVGRSGVGWGGVGWGGESLELPGYHCHLRFQHGIGRGRGGLTLVGEPTCLAASACLRIGFFPESHISEVSHPRLFLGSYVGAGRQPGGWRAGRWGGSITLSCASLIGFVLRKGYGLFIPRGLALGMGLGTLEDGQAPILFSFCGPPTRPFY